MTVTAIKSKRKELKESKGNPKATQSDYFRINEVVSHALRDAQKVIEHRRRLNSQEINRSQKKD